MEQSDIPEDDTGARLQKMESLKSEIEALEIQLAAKRKELWDLDVTEALYNLRFYGDTSSDEGMAVSSAKPVNFSEGSSSGGYNSFLRAMLQMSTSDLGVHPLNLSSGDQHSVVRQRPLLIECKVTEHRPMQFAREFSIQLCRFFLLMPNTEDRIAKLLKFSASLIKQKKSQIVDMTINSLQIAYEELKERIVSGKAKDIEILEKAFETYIEQFWGLKMHGFKFWSFTKLGSKSWGLKTQGTYQVLNQFMTEILNLANIHETTLTLKDDILRRFEDSLEDHTRLVNSLQTFRKSSRGRKSTEHIISSQVEEDIRRMWSRQCYVVSFEIEQEWERMVDLCSNRILDRATVIDMDNLVHWIDKNEMGEDGIAGLDELPIFGADFSIDMLDKMVLQMKSGIYRKEATKKWQEGNSSLTQWLEHHDRSTDAWKLLNDVQVQALQLATRLSHQLSHMHTMMLTSLSRHGNQHAVRALENLFVFLEKLGEAQQHNVVINKLIMVFESAAKEASRLNQGEIPDGNRLKGLSEPVTETKPGEIDNLLEKLLNQALRLELVFSHPYMPGTPLLSTELVLSLVVPFLTKIEKEMNSLEQAFLELPSSSSVAGSIFNTYMEQKIRDIWA